MVKGKKIEKGKMEIMSDKIYGNTILKDPYKTGINQVRED